MCAESQQTSSPSLVDERLDDMANDFRHTMKRFNNRMTFNNLRLSERYFKGEIHVLVHFRLGNNGEYVASLQREYDVGRLCAEKHRILGGSIGIEFNSQEPAFSVSNSAWRHALESVRRTNGDQQFVLVDNVKGMEMPENLSGPSSVWFDIVNRFFGILPHSLYSSALLGYVFVGVLSNGEVRLPQIFRSNSGRDRHNVIGQVVESRTQGMDCITDDQREAGFDRTYVSEVVSAISSLRIVIGLDSITVLTKEVPCLLEVVDVYFGPF